MFPELAEEFRPGQRSLVAGHLGPEGLHEGGGPGGRDAEEPFDVAAGEEGYRHHSCGNTLQGLSSSPRVRADARWTDVDLSVSDDIVVVTVPGSKTNPSADGGDVRQLVGGCAAALRRLHAATKPAPANSVVGLGVHQITRRFSAACAAAGLEGRRTPHSGRVGLAVELAARGATTRDVQLAGGWKNPGMVARYAARVGAGAGAVGRFMRIPAGGKPDN